MGSLRRQFEEGYTIYEVNLLDDSLHWKTQQVIRITLGGLHPRIFVLERQ
jgi:hypothetical protein